MTSSYTRLEIARRSPRRLSVTIPYGLHQRLIERSDQEGRSISNLAAYLLEFALSR
ncbi:MAG: hypothetical protein WBM08_05600 [Prochlorococcaceae cyanobacterium]